MEDLKGPRLRSGGAPWSRFAEHFGAVPAQIQVNDIFESMSQGVVDGSVASIADLLSFRLVELVDYVTLLPLGLYQSTSNFTTAITTCDSLSIEDRAAMARAATRAGGPGMSITIGFHGVAILFQPLALRVPLALALIAVSFGGGWRGCRG